MSVKTTPVPSSGSDIRDTRLADAISERYLSYALSIIMSRSLPDVRDGLKPVHRRLLYALIVSSLVLVVTEGVLRAFVPEGLSSSIGVGEALQAWMNGEDTPWLDASGLRPARPQLRRWPILPTGDPQRARLIDGRPLSLGAPTQCRLPDHPASNLP